VTARRHREEDAGEDDVEGLEDLSRKEDKTMHGGKTLKEQDKKAEKLGEAAFSHAKKILRGREPDSEAELRDDSEWVDEDAY